MMLAEDSLIDVIVRTKNSEALLEQCLRSIFNEIPVRKVIIIDAGSTDKTIEIASTFEQAEIHIKPELNLGEATRYGFSSAKTEWVAVIDSDVVLRQGWFESIKNQMDGADAIEGCRIDHYSFQVKRITAPEIGWLGHTLIKREPILNMDLDMQFGEDTAVKFNFDKQGKVWKKTANSYADHYTKIVDNTKHYRTGMVFRPEPQVIDVPKSVQIQQGHIVRKCQALTTKQALKLLFLVPVYEAYWAFRKNFWFCLAYFKVV